MMKEKRSFLATFFIRFILGMKAFHEGELCLKSIQFT